MENKIDIAAILKDCPRGMELDCTIYDDVTLNGVVFESEYHYENTNTYPIEIVTKSGFSTRLTKYGQNVDISEAKCVIFPKGKTTWEGFQRPFVDGDIIADDHGNIAIYKGMMWYNKKLADYYCGYRKSDDKFLIKEYGDGHFGMIEELHYASKEEKQKLFDVIKENDHEWDAENKTLEKIKERKFDIKTCLNCKTFKDMHQNCPYSPIWRYKDLNEAKSHLRDETDCQFWNEIPKTKTLEKLIEPKFKVGDRVRSVISSRYYTVVGIDENSFHIKSDTEPFSYKVNLHCEINYELVPKFDINTLKTFDEVLVRLTNNCVWMPKLFSHYDTDPKVKCYPFVTIENIGYTQCIPYKGNEHLCRKTNNCDEFYRIWEE